MKLGAMQIPELVQSILMTEDLTAELQKLTPEEFMQKALEFDTFKMLLDRVGITDPINLAKMKDFSLAFNTKLRKFIVDELSLWDRSENLATLITSITLVAVSLHGACTQTKEMSVLLHHLGGNNDR